MLQPVKLDYRITST